MTSGDNRERWRETFESAADLYQRARPEYPSALFDRLVAAAELGKGDHLLEIGCATGKATLPLAARGYRITAIELGPDLASAARRNLAAYPDVDIINATFEDWMPLPDTRFDLVFAATAWHWIDPAARYEKTHDVLRADGHLAMWSASHVFPDGGDAFFREIQTVYDEIGEPQPPGQGWPSPGELDDERTQIADSGLFDVVDVRHFDWETIYDADGYIDLLNTFSGHITMEAWQRDRLYGEIRSRLAARPDRRLRRHWGAVLHVARRRNRWAAGG